MENLVVDKIQVTSHAKKLGTFSTYSVKVYFEGEWIDRSFFPDYWLTNELMDCYYDVINNPTLIKSNQLRTTYEKVRASGIKITIVIANTGKGITFFPNLRSW